MPPLPIPFIPHLKNDEASVIGTAEYLSGTTQGVGLPPLNVEVQEPEGIYLVQDKSEARHGENCLIRIYLLLLLRILPVLSYFPPFVF